MFRLNLVKFEVTVRSNRRSNVHELLRTENHTLASDGQDRGFLVGVGLMSRYYFTPNHCQCERPLNGLFNEKTT